MLIVAGIEGNCQIVCHRVGSELCALYASYGQVCHLVVYRAAFFEMHYSPVAFELMFERFRHAARKEIVEVSHQIRRRFPCIVLYTFAERFVFVVRASPTRQCAVIFRSAPLSCPVVHPYGAVGGMPCAYYGSVLERSYGIYYRFSRGSHFKFIAYRRYYQTVCRRFLVGANSFKGFVVYALYRQKRFTVEPPCTHNPVIVWCCSRCNGCYRRSAVQT